MASVSQVREQQDRQHGRQQAEVRQELGHVLPRWFQIFQDHAFLTILIVAEMFINGNMMASGLVADPSNPLAGGWSHWLSIGLWATAFAAGAVMGGMAVRTSAATFYWLGRHKGIALFNFVGLLLFVLFEGWAGAVQRSFTSIMSPADVAVLAWAGITHPSLSISDVMVAAALPLAAMFWGFSAMKREQKSAAEIAQDGAAKLAEAQVKAQVRQAQAAGWGATFRAGAQAAFARKEDQPLDADATAFAGQDGGFDGDNPGDDDGTLTRGFQRQTGDGDGAVSTGKDGRSGRMLRAVSQVGGVPSGWLDARELTRWLRATLAVETSASEALAFIRAQASARRCLPREHVQGSPWIALKAPTLQAARRKWGARPTEQVSGA